MSALVRQRSEVTHYGLQFLVFGGGARGERDDRHCAEMCFARKRARCVFQRLVFPRRSSMIFFPHGQARPVFGAGGEYGSNILVRVFRQSDAIVRYGNL